MDPPEYRVPPLMVFVSKRWDPKLNTDPSSPTGWYVSDGWEACFYLPWGHYPFDPSAKPTDSTGIYIHTDHVGPLDADGYPTGDTGYEETGGIPPTDEEHRGIYMTCSPTAVRVPPLQARSVTDQVLLSWLPDCVADVVGYNILRSRKKGGPYERVNRGLILARGDSPADQGHSLADEGVERGKYFYQIEQIDVGGHKQLGQPTAVQVQAAVQRYLRGPRRMCLPE